MARKIAVIVGSIRKGSFSRQTANALAELAPQNLQLEIAEIDKLTIYNQDLDENMPPEWIAFKQKIKSADGVLFVTPEYNRSVPGALKNAVDIASRPYGQNSFDKKPAAVISVSPGTFGAFGANHHLRQSLVFLNTSTMAAPEAYYAKINESFSPDGKLTDERTKKSFKNFIDAFGAWVEAQLGE